MRLCSLSVTCGVVRLLVFFVVVVFLVYFFMFISVQVVLRVRCQKLVPQNIQTLREVNLSAGSVIVKFIYFTEKFLVVLVLLKLLMVSHVREGIQYDDVLSPESGVDVRTCPL